jgi:uncharacterized YigZ family protein
MRVLTRRHTFEMEEKKSRFIALAALVTTVDEVVTTVDEVSDPQATHNCFAYRIGDQYRFSDDGEPGGTAGRPILAAIDRLEIDRCLVVVTRFFGGIKLGAGGLARAYGKCAAECLRAAPTEQLRRMVRLSVTAPFETIGDLYPLLHAHGAAKHSEAFGEKGITLEIDIEEGALDHFQKDLANATRGRALAERKRDRGT